MQAVHSGCFCPCGARGKPSAGLGEGGSSRPLSAATWAGRRLRSRRVHGRPGQASGHGPGSGKPGGEEPVLDSVLTVLSRCPHHMQEAAGGSNSRPFPKGPGSKHFRLPGPHRPHGCHSALLLQSVWMGQCGSVPIKLYSQNRQLPGLARGCRSLAPAAGAEGHRHRGLHPLTSSPPKGAASRQHCHTGVKVSR